MYAKRSKPGGKKNSKFRICLDPVSLFWYQISVERTVKLNYSFWVQSDLCQYLGFIRAFY
jgi:hypothetical protein